MGTPDGPADSHRRPEVFDGYARLLRDNGCTVTAAEDTGRFPSYVDLYLSMVDMQFGYDVLRILGFNADLMRTIAGEFGFMRELAHAGKIAQGRFIAIRQRSRRLAQRLR